VIAENNEHTMLVWWRRVWRYRRDKQNHYIEEGQTAQETKEKGQTTIYKTLHIKQNIE